MKMNRKQNSLIFALAAWCFLSAGCGGSAVSDAQTNAGKNSPSSPQTQLPQLPPAKKIADGIVVHEVSLNPTGTTGDVWIYLPEKPAQGKLPVILITAAGSYLLNGATLGDGDRPEHLPYVKAGYAVVAYEIDGDFGATDVKDATGAQIAKVVGDFKNSRAGLNNQKAALDYALSKVPALDGERIYVAGHSSAATHALLAAANEPRVKAAIAYAPEIDLEKRFADSLGELESLVPGFTKFNAENSPRNNVAKIKIPLFLFHAEDDSNIAINDVAVFAAELKKSNPNVTFATVKTGDHYDSMIEKGIPQAIQWLNKFSKKP